MKKLQYGVSVGCAGLLRLEEGLRALEAAGCGEVCVEVMDGAFTPGFGFGPELIAAVRRACGLPCTAHLLVYRPERHVEAFIRAGCAGITVHVEAGVHLQRVLAQIRAAEAKAGIALNPGTPLTKIDYLLDYADGVLVLAGEPGYGRIVPSVFERVRILRQNLDHRQLPARLAVSGPFTAKAAAILAREGAEVLILGQAQLPDGREPGDALAAFREAVAREWATA